MSGDNLRLKPAIVPAAQAAGTVNGIAIDRSNARDGSVVVLTGAVAGAPSTSTVAVKLQDSDDGTSRGVLRSLLTTPITVTAHETAEGVVFDFRAEARLDGVFAGRLTVRKSNTTELVAPARSAHQWTVHFAGRVNGNVAVCDEVRDTLEVGA